jgi:creatinine amidohydrolase/Fe(II)-dependent formamide hydrolase-like protein
MSLAVHGFSRFFFINDHDSNVTTVTAAFDVIYAARSLGGPVDSVRCRMRFWSEGPRYKKGSEELYPGVNGSHATASEVSLSLHTSKPPSRFRPRRNTYRYQVQRHAERRGWVEPDFRAEQDRQLTVFIPRRPIGPLGFCARGGDRD